MANLNDFKLLNLKCKRYYDILETELDTIPESISEKEKERIGFYLFMLESICNIKEIGEIIRLMTDQDFNNKLYLYLSENNDPNNKYSFIISISNGNYNGQDFVIELQNKLN